MTFRSRGDRTAGGQAQQCERPAGYNALLVGLIGFVVVATGVSTGEQVGLLVTEHRSDPAIRLDGPRWPLPSLSGQGIPLLVVPGPGAVVGPAPLLESQPPVGLGLTGASVAHPGTVSPKTWLVDRSLWLEAAPQWFALRTSDQLRWLPQAGGADVLQPRPDDQHLRRARLLDG